MNEPRPLDPEAIKSVSLALLIRFDQFCKEHEIRYSLGMGSLLGAVRHNGFIPWDDDIDVILTRPEYEKLNRIPKEAFPPDCALISLEREPRFSAPLAKLIDTGTRLRQTDHAEKLELGVYIDLFVYDALPGDKRLWARTFRRGDLLQRLWTASELKPKRGEKNPLKLLYKFLAQRLGLARFFAKRLSRYAQRISFQEGREAACLCFSTFPRSQFTFPIQEMERFSLRSFEGRSFPTFEHADRFLQAWYGDYWKLPPPEKRKGHHRYEAYYK